MKDEYKKNAWNVWNKILNGEKNLSNEEAREMKKIVSNLRKEKRFRE